MDQVGGTKRLKKRRAPSAAITPEQVEIFFASLTDTCNIKRSARAAGFSSNWAYTRRRVDAEFRNGWAAAVREGYAKLELVLLERAMTGTPKLVRTSRGDDRIMREYSTALSVALLKRHADTADAAQYQPSEDELTEVRERILEKLEGLKQRRAGKAAEG